METRAHPLRGAVEQPWLLVLGVPAAIAYFMVEPGSTASVAAISAFDALCILTLAVGLVVHRPRPLPAWVSIGAGLSAWLVGDTVYAVLESRGEAPYPSVADVFYYAGYVGLAAGVGLLARRRSRGGPRSGALDAAIITVAAATPIAMFVVLPQLEPGSGTLSEMLVSAGYPVLDIVVLGMAARLWTSEGRSSPALRLLMAGLLCVLAADLTYAYLTFQGTWVDGSAMELLFFLSWAALGASAATPSVAAVATPVDTPPDPLHRLRFLLMIGLACLVGPATSLAALASSDARAQVLVPFVGSVLIFVLCALRTLDILGDLRAARRAELALRRRVEAMHGTAADVAAASDRTTIEAALLDGVRRVLAVAGVAPDLVALHVAEAPVAELVLPVSDGVRTSWITVDTVLAAEPQDAVRTMAEQTSTALARARLDHELSRRRGERRFRILAQNVSDVIVVLDGQGAISYVTPSVHRLLGLPPDAVLGEPLRLWVVEQDWPQIDHVLVHARGPLRREVSLRFSVVHCDGSQRIVEGVGHHVDDDDVSGLLLTCRDVTDRVGLEEQLTHRATHDGLTGLANRAVVEQWLDAAAARVSLDGGLRGDEPRGAGRGGTGGADGACDGVLVFCDLDDFKTVNDSLGHHAGDTLLVEIAARLRRALRDDDVAARLGGDEFAVLLPGVTVAEAETVALRLVDEVGGPVDVGGATVPVSLSIGLAAYGPGRPAAEVMRDADTAMYQSKASGGGVTAFAPPMHDAAVSRLELTGALRLAVDRGELRVHYQPLVHLGSGRPVGVEALVRWQHPSRGLLGPAEFIALAESSGAILELGAHVLRTACADVAAVRAAAPEHAGLQLSVNLSVQQLRDDALLDRVCTALADSGLPAASLVLEVTESVLLTDDPEVTRRLAELRHLGVRLALDDFGTGYASLAYLNKYRFDVLKVAREFVAGASEDQSSHLLLGSMLSLAEAMGMQVVVEGVETQAERSLLLDLGYDLAQGYLFARPVPGVTQSLALRGLRAVPLQGSSGLAADLA